MKKSKPRPSEGEAPPAAGIRKAALALLARREHTARELARKLTARGFAAQTVASVLDELVREGLLSDARFTEQYVLSRAERGFGPVRIRAELMERGVDEALIRRYLDEGAPEWAARTEQARRKRFGKALPRAFEERARQARFLQYRGFTPEQIHAVLREE